MMLDARLFIVLCCGPILASGQKKESAKVDKVEELEPRSTGGKSIQYSEIVEKKNMATGTSHSLKINKKITKLVIDTDGGPDDAAAILLLTAAQAAHKDAFQIVGITCTYGNSYVDNVVTNVLKTLTIANRSDIVVHKGAHEPIISTYNSNNYFGADGFGNATYDQNITDTFDATKPAAVALLELAKHYTGELSILILGPPTNVAMAMKLDPNFIKNVCHMYTPNGVAHGFGSVGINKNFNSNLDPESNYMLLNKLREANKVMHLLPGETAYYAHITKEWRFKTLGKINSTSVQFLNSIENEYLQRNTEWACSDVKLAATMLWPEIVTKNIRVYATAGLGGEARGMILFDYTNTTRYSPNVEIIDEIDVDKFKRVLVDYFSRD